MSTVLEASYSKKAGLPNFSSHGFTLSVRTEIENVSEVLTQGALLYRLLQACVDEEIQRPGFLPPDALSYENCVAEDGFLVGPGANLEWSCTAPQRAFIVRFVEKHGLNKSETDKLAKELHGVGVRALNNTQAGDFISELITRHTMSTVPRGS